MHLIAATPILSHHTSGHDQSHSILVVFYHFSKSLELDIHQFQSISILLKASIFGKIHTNGDVESNMSIRIQNHSEIQEEDEVNIECRLSCMKVNFLEIAELVVPGSEMIQKSDKIAPNSQPNDRDNIEIRYIDIIW